MRRAVLLVAIVNFAYFFVGYAVAKKIGSVALFADSIDFLEDAAVSFLVVMALGWSATQRAIVGMGLAALLLVPAFAALWTAWRKLSSPIPPDASLLMFTAVGALAINFSCAFFLTKYRAKGGNLIRAAYFSARNDAFANFAIISAGAVTHFWSSGWPDLIVGIGIAAMNADAAFEVWKTARGDFKLS